MTNSLDVVLLAGRAAVSFQDAPDLTVRDTAFLAAAAILREAGEYDLAFELENGCLRLEPGEPFFALRGRDPTAAGAVRAWIRDNERMRGEGKIESASETADRMDRFPKKVPG